ncbi:MAG: GyrI-like domain-containing protein, partial [Bacteroidota bacterium]
GLTDKDLEGGSMHATAYGQIQGAMEGKTLMAGAPMCVIHNYEDGVMDVEFAIPEADSIGVEDGLTMAMIPGGKTMQKSHFGSYESTATTWQSMADYIEANKVEMTYSPYEVYVNDPTEVADPSEIETLIVFPVK